MAKTRRHLRRKGRRTRSRHGGGNFSMGTFMKNQAIAPTRRVLGPNNFENESNNNNTLRGKPQGRVFPSSVPKTAPVTPTMPVKTLGTTTERKGSTFRDAASIAASGLGSIGKGFDALLNFIK